MTSLHSNGVRVGLAFLSFGPYHLARLSACESVPGFAVVPISMSRVQSEYAWGVHEDSRLVVIETERDLDDLDHSEWAQRIDAKIDIRLIDVMFIAGYSHVSMLSLIQKCESNGVPWVIMGDSQEADERRFFVREWIKSRIVKLASAALVAGKPHREYIHKLGHAS